MHLSLIALCLLNFWPAPAANPAAPEYCYLEGAVYVEEVAAFAKYRVYVQDIESFADLVVYREESESFADAPGRWYITDNRAFADFSIHIEEVENFADFSIAYTDFRSAAGCK
ncbi:MAG: hypothetical protein EAZ89_19090 [Bacteroidetes bacterium]|nr:MAG: hypothetical protein EAZ89_19090 [Bacteroidota bacterium]